MAMNILYTARQQALHSAGFALGAARTVAPDARDAQAVMKLAEAAAIAYEAAYGKDALGDRWERRAFLDGWFIGAWYKDAAA